MHRDAGSLAVFKAWNCRGAQHIKAGYNLSKRLTTWPVEPQQKLGGGCLGLSPDRQCLFHPHKMGACFMVPARLLSVLCQCDKQWLRVIPASLSEILYVSVILQIKCNSMKKLHYSTLVADGPC